MRRRINFKGLLILVVVAAVGGLGAFELHRFQVQRNARALYERAQAALDPDNESYREMSKVQRMRTAMDYLQRYLGFNPPGEEKKKALLEYANLRADEKIATTPMARFRAIMVLEQALQQNPDHDKERRRLIDLALEIGRPGDALRHIDDHLLNQQQNQNNSDLLALKARCQFESGKYIDALKSYEKAILAPNPSVETYARLARLLRQYGDDVRPSKAKDKDDLVDQANRYINQMVKAHPTSAKAYLARAEYHHIFPAIRKKALVPDIEQEIEQDILKARELSGDDPDVLMALADLARFRRAPDLARRYLRDGCAKHPDNWRLYSSLAELEREDGKLGAALDALQKGLTQVPEQPDLLWSLANLYILRGAEADFNNTVSRLAAAGMPPPELNFLRGRFRFESKKWTEAVTELDRAFDGLLGRTEGGRNAFVFGLARDAGLLLGDSYGKMGNFDRAYHTFSRVATLDPQSVQARFGMATAKRNMGQLGEAIENYRQLMRLRGAPAQLWVELARLTLIRNLDREPHNWREVDDALTQAEQRVIPLPGEVVLMRLDSLALQQRNDEARAYLEALLLSRVVFPAPRLGQVLTALLVQQEKLPAIYYLARASLAEMEGKTKEALTWLENGAREYDDPLYLRLARASYWARRGGSEAAKALGLLEGDLTKFSAEQRRWLLTALAEAQRTLRQPAEEKRLWERVVEAWPEDLGAHLALFDLALAARDDAAMKRESDAIKHIEREGGVLWRYAEVRRALLRAEGKEGREEALKEAKEQLAAVRALSSSWARVALCEAAVADLEGKPAAAAEKYLEAFRKGERSAAALSRGFELLSIQGRQADAREILRKLPRQVLTPNLQRLAAETLLASRDPVEAVRMADATLASKPNDARVQLWAGRLYWEAGQAAKAEASLRKACELDGSIPDAWVSLVYFLVTGGQRAAAAEVLPRMEKALSDKAAPLAYAQCHDAAGDRDKAKSYYAQALASGPDDLTTLRGVASYYLRTGRLKEAEQLLKDIVKKGQPKAPEQVRWARNSLRLLAYLGKDFKERQKLLDSIGRPDALPSGADRQSVTDQRTRAGLLAELPDRKSRTEAINILENLVTLQEATPDDLFRLARLYERQDDWSRARRHLESLVSLPAGQQPLYLAHYARGLLRHETTEQARQVLDRLEKVAAGRFVTAEIKARLLHKQGNTREAVDLLKRRAASGNDLTPTAVLLEELGDADEAEKLLLAHLRADGKPSAAYPLIAFYARQKQASKALDLCEQLWKKCPAEDMIDLAMQVVGESAEDAATLARVEKLLEGSRVPNADSSALTTALGHVRTLQGRDAEAEQVYRRAIERNPRDILALNALAWLLSMQPKKGKEAFELAQKAIDVGGRYPWLVDTQAVALLAMGQAEKAIALLQEVVAEAPTAAAYFHLAKAYQQNKKAPDARRALDKAMKEGLKPGDLHPTEREALKALQRDLKQQ
jgi:tetratricopeptide (TPR) repeat protein